MKNVLEKNHSEVNASTGPRPRGRGMVSELTTRNPLQTTLQRGRARAGAEWGVVLSRLTPRMTLQRGRARAGAEWFLCGWFAQRDKVLQRGRARAGAE